MRELAKMLTALLRWLKPKSCQHAFALEDLENTGIPELEKPTTNGYQEWADYYRDIYDHDSHTKRVVWPCAKCGKVFYAHCGLDISPKHGPRFFRAAPTGAPEVIPANTKPPRGGWHWPTYWQVQADSAKDVTPAAPTEPRK